MYCIRMQVFRIARYVFIGPLYYYVYETVAFETPSIRTGKWFQIVGNAWPSTWQTRPHKSSIKTIAIVKAKESVHPNTQHSSTHRQCCAPFFMSSHAIKNGVFSACHIIVYIKYMGHHVDTKILARINQTHAPHVQFRFNQTNTDIHPSICLCQLSISRGSGDV